jgi:hypothetical protein
MLTFITKSAKRKLTNFMLQLIFVIMLIPFTGLAQKVSPNADSVLPVTISSMKAYPYKNGVNLDWYVTQQLATNRFEIEKSVNGVDFTVVATIIPDATSGSVAYSWFDPNPSIGNNYYRINMYESSLVSAYTQIVEATITKGGTPTMSVYPNPVVGSTVNIKVTNMDKTNTQLIISNNLGQIVSNKTVEIGGVSAPVDVDNLRPGIYHVKIGNLTAQIVKL